MASLFFRFSLNPSLQLLKCQSLSSRTSLNAKSRVETLTSQERKWQDLSCQDCLPLGPLCHLPRDQFRRQRTSASRLTSTSTTTSSKSTTTNSTSAPTSTTTSTSPRSSLTSTSLVFSSQSRSSPKGRSGTEEERSKRTLSEATRMNSIPPLCLHSTKKNT